MVVTSTNNGYLDMYILLKYFSGNMLQLVIFLKGHIVTIYFQYCGSLPLHGGNLGR